MAGTYTLLFMILMLTAIPQCIADDTEKCIPSEPNVTKVGPDFLEVNLSTDDDINNCEYRPTHINWKYKEITEGTEIEAETKPVVEGTNYLYMIKDLSPGTGYRIFIEYVFPDDTTTSNFIEISTCIGNSPAPDISAYSFGEDWFSVRWQPHNNTCFPVQRYIVTYKKQKSYRTRTTYNKSCPTEECKCLYWPTFYCLTLDQTQEDKLYTVEMYAQYEAGKSDKKEINVTTKQGAPSAPVNLHLLNVTETEFTLAWSYPFIPKGQITTFALIVTANSTYLKSNITTMEPKNIEENIKNITYAYTYQVRDLLPSTLYEVEVWFVTKKPGEKSTLPVETKPIFPIFNQDLNLLEESVGNDTATIVLPPEIMNLTTESGYYLLVTEVDRASQTMPSQPLIDKDLHKALLNEVEEDKRKYTWIAAFLKLESYEKEFIIGTNISTTDEKGNNFSNGPLEPGYNYSVTLIAVNRQKDIQKVNSTHLKSLIVTKYYGALLKEITTIPLEDTSHDHTVHEEDHSNSMIGLIALGFLVPLPLIGYWLLLRHRRKKREVELKNFKESKLNIMEDEDTPVLSTRSLEVVLGLLELESLPEAPSETLSRRIQLSELEDYVLAALASGDLKNQHKLFPRGCVLPCKYGNLPANRNKNRYGDLVAYDETRVILTKLPEDPFSDYINANYIDGYKCPKMYIATQGPKANTVMDFWRMVWEEKVQIICMLANVWEKDKVKCEQYWPELGKQVIHGHVNVMTTARQVFADYTFRNFTISCLGEQRSIRQMHFTSWPDHGVPLYPQSVGAYLKHLLATPRGSGPILVHCSAGVGRTGTIILADICLRMVAAESAVDVLYYLQSIRRQRPNLVDNVDQYRLVHLALLECLVEEQTGVPCDGDFRDRIEILRREGELERQYKRLNKRCSQDKALIEYLEIGLGGLSSRISSVASFHAVSVSGFRTKGQFIVSQLPASQSVTDFWQLILKRKIGVIVMLNEVESNQILQNVFPAENSPIKLETGIEVTFIRVTGEKHRIHTLQLTTANEKIAVNFVHLLGWSQYDDVPESPGVLLQLWEDTERLYKGKGTILITCPDGVTACGLFVTLSFLIEKMKLEQVCDVCHAIRTLRQNREKFITSKKQFEFLYEAAAEFLESFQAYANFQ